MVYGRIDHNHPWVQMASSEGLVGDFDITYEMPDIKPSGFSLVLYKNKTPHARCVLKIQDWLANNLSIITQPVRDEMAALIVQEITDDIKEETDED
jgi:hypothetical protein